MKVAFLAVAVLAIAGAAIYFESSVYTAKASGPVSAAQNSASPALRSQSFTLPLFFEQNQGQTAPQVKFLARGSGYGLFLTSDEAVLTLRRSNPSSQISVPSSQKTTGSVIRMRLDGANTSARVSGASPMAGKSNYFIGNDRSKWRSGIPQFAQVEYQAVYPGVDLVYYGNQGQLEYDFRVAPGADPNQIALSFNGAATRLEEGDLVLSTDNGDVRFRAPRIYQPASKNSLVTEMAVAGSFRQLADNKIGFTIGDYDRSRELVIDPTLTYSTYLGGSGIEGSVKVAVDSAGLIYVAGSTTSSDFPTDIALANNPNNPPYQPCLGEAGGSATNCPTSTATNIFIAVLNPTLIPPLYSCTPNPPDPPYACTSQLVYATYLGSSGVDNLSGVAVDSAFSIYVAGTTTSACTTAATTSCFPTTGNAFQNQPAVAGTHGFLSKLSFGGNPPNLVYGLSYSTYLAGNGTDNLTGLAIDSGCGQKACNAYVTGNTTSTNPASAGFPANPSAFQLCPYGPINLDTTCPPGGPSTFFASKINTTGSGFLSMIYSTYFGGGNPEGATAVGGGVAVDQTGPTPYMYITGTTNMLPTSGPNGEAPFPLVAAQQACLNLASETSCNGGGGGTNTDAFAAKILPKAGSTLVYSTYLGGSGNDTGNAIAVDSASSAYITGSTASPSWGICSGFQCSLNGSVNAFVVKIGPLTGSVYPVNYFTYLGGSGQDSGQDIKIDSLQAIHVVGNTTGGLNVLNPLAPSAISNYDGSAYGSGGDAFVALLGTTLAGRGAGDYLTYLGGNDLDQGTGVALDQFGATYVAGTTKSSNFPTVTPFQTGLNASSQDAFVSKLGAASTLQVVQPTSSPSPNPVNAGAPVAFTFDIINNGPDNATFVTFYATVPTGLNVISQQAKVTGGTGTCGTLLGGNVISCNIQNLAACGTSCTTGASVEVDVTPTTAYTAATIMVSGAASANGGPIQGTKSQTANVVDFLVSASTSTPTINAGDTGLVNISFCPSNTQLGYTGTITPSQTTAPSMVTATTPTFNPTTVSLAGTSCQSTTLSIPTVARPVTTGSLLRGSRFATFSATWLPIGGLTLAGLGLGAGRKRRRWLAGAVLCVIAGIVALQAGCGSSSSSAVTGGGTVAQTYTITINGSAGTGSSHSASVNIRVN